MLESAENNYYTYFWGPLHPGMRICSSSSATQTNRHTHSTFLRNNFIICTLRNYSESFGNVWKTCYPKTEDILLYSESSKFTINSTRNWLQSIKKENNKSLLGIGSKWFQEKGIQIVPQG
jgi:hypothetical protein